MVGLVVSRYLVGRLFGGFRCAVDVLIGGF